MILVDTDEICAAIKDVFEDTRAMLEPAGALAIAGAKACVARTGIRDKTLVAVASGANMNFDRLRFVAEEAELGEKREAILAVTIPERPGSFREFCALIGARNITEFNYRYADPGEAHVFVGLQVRDRKETRQIVRRLRRRGLKTLDFSDNELAKLHIRHTVGGHAPAVDNEILYRFEFPERPGALMKFLDGDEQRLEHHPVPLPQPRCRLRARAGRHAGAAPGQAQVPRLPGTGRLSLPGRIAKSRLPIVSCLRTEKDAVSRLRGPPPRRPTR